MYVYSANDIQFVDTKAEEQGFSTFALMENAGRNIFQKLTNYINKQDDIVILSGRGNNGGDGIVIARYLKKAGYQVTLHFPIGLPKTETAQAHLHYYEQHFTVAETLYSEEKPTVIIDALLGVGATPPLRDHLAQVVRWANHQLVYRYAIDIPTGVHSDHGAITEEGELHGAVIFKADRTFMLHGAKPSAFLVPAGDYYGELIAIPIGLQQRSNIQLITEQSVRATLPKRNNAAHKGTFGTSLLFAGCDHMPGSAMLAAIGAIRSGTGKLIIGTTKFASSVITPNVPEVTYLLDGLHTFCKTGHLPEKVRAIGIGPGLDDENMVEQALELLLQTDIPLVLDAGALLKNQNWKRESPTVLTPHPGEFSRLTGISTSDIQSNRITLAQDFAAQHDVILVLKGQYTIIAMPHGEVYINPTGNTGLSKGGSGDVLTGMITSMLSY